MRIKSKTFQLVSMGRLQLLNSSRTRYEIQRVENLKRKEPGADDGDDDDDVKVKAKNLKLVKADDDDDDDVLQLPSSMKVIPNPQPVSPFVIAPPPRRSSRWGRCPPRSPHLRRLPLLLGLGLGGVIVRPENAKWEKESESVDDDDVLPDLVEEEMPSLAEATGFHLRQSYLYYFLFFLCALWLFLVYSC